MGNIVNVYRIRHQKNGSFKSVGFNYCGSFFFVFAAFASGPFYEISIH